ncbi:MAG: hypothetical protein WCB05_19845 [Candidatus Sulfotelmatobacter sp.]
MFSRLGVFGRKLPRVIAKAADAMRGGDLSVEGEVGGKDLELTGGGLTVEVGSPEDYAHVDLSVKFGDVSCVQFGDPKGWLGNSVRKDGNGKYRLHAHVMAGDLVLKS